MQNDKKEAKSAINKLEKALCQKRQNRSKQTTKNKMSREHTECNQQNVKSRM